jgi:hypothetical protein
MPSGRPRIPAQKPFTSSPWHHRSCPLLPWHHRSCSPLTPLLLLVPCPTPHRDVATATIFAEERSSFARKTQRRRSRTRVVCSGKRRWTHTYVEHRSPTHVSAECHCPATSPMRGGLLGRPQFLPPGYCVAKNQLLPAASRLAHSSPTLPP